MSHAHNLSLSIVSHSKSIYLRVNVSMGLELYMFASKRALSLGPTYRFIMYGMNGEEDSRYKTAEVVEKYCAHSGIEMGKDTNKLV